MKMPMVMNIFLNDVNLKINENETVALVGPSGGQNHNCIINSKILGC